LDHHFHLGMNTVLASSSTLTLAKTWHARLGVRMTLVASPVCMAAMLLDTRYTPCAMLLLNPNNRAKIGCR